MAQALALAAEAAAAGEVPVGCVIVRNGEIVGRGRNRREEKQATASHAEMEAIAQANERLGTWRLEDCELYVTLEPCPMCAGAILNARIRRVYYGARDEVMGACGGVLNLFMEGFPRPPQLVGNVCGDECRDVLQAFFREVREKNADLPSGVPLKKQSHFLCGHPSENFHRSPVKLLKYCQHLLKFFCNSGCLQFLKLLSAPAAMITWKRGSILSVVSVSFLFLQCISGISHGFNLNIRV